MLPRAASGIEPVSVELAHGPGIVRGMSLAVWLRLPTVRARLPRTPRPSRSSFVRNCVRSSGPRRDGAVRQGPSRSACPVAQASRHHTALERVFPGGCFSAILRAFVEESEAVLDQRLVQQGVLMAPRKRMVLSLRVRSTMPCLRAGHPAW